MGLYGKIVFLSLSYRGFFSLGVGFWCCSGTRGLPYKMCVWRYLVFAPPHSQQTGRKRGRETPQSRKKKVVVRRENPDLKHNFLFSFVLHLPNTSSGHNVSPSYFFLEVFLHSSLKRGMKSCCLVIYIFFFPKSLFMALSVVRFRLALASPLRKTNKNYTKEDECSWYALSPFLSQEVRIRVESLLYFINGTPVYGHN